MDQRAAAVVIVLVVTLVLWSVMNGPHWDHGPYAAYHKIKKIYGPPTHMSAHKHGAAVWLFGKHVPACGSKEKSNIPFERIMVIDENIPTPKTGVSELDAGKPNTNKDEQQVSDYFYVTMKCDIPSDKVCDVSRISPHIQYDAFKEELTVRCQSMESAVATFTFVNGVIKDSISQPELTIGNRYKQSLKVADIESVNNYRVVQTMKDDYDRQKI